MAASHDSLDAGALLRGLVPRLAAAGADVWRASYSLMTKHPEVLWRSVRWRAGDVTIDDQPHARLDDPYYRDSAVRRVRETGAAVRVPLVDGALPYPICNDLRAQGGTDYLVQPLVFTTGQVGFASWTTRAPGGFSDEALRVLDEIRPLLALRIELESSYHATRTLMPVYLGHNAARRVLAGEVQRGKGELIDAVIWFSDMRDFTALSDRTSPGQVVETLDRLFDTIANAIAERGGEVLKFIGDAVLAIFPVGDDARTACRNALAAAEAALAAIEGSGVSIGVALHRGTVMYGNIGAKDRLDFTVISSAVNEVSRLEGLCKKLSTRLALSAAFAAAADVDGLVDLGAHELKGVSAPLRVYTR